MSERLQKKSRDRKTTLSLLAIALPGIIYLIINNYMPMAGIFLAFKNYSLAKGPFRSSWCGFKNFEFLFKTKDANAISLSAEPEKMELDFDRDYGAFLKLLRRCNGPATHIVCALGSMDYYLCDNIVRAVEAYRAETGDENISLLKYMRISSADPLGACAHPNVVTQEKMAEALAKHIRALEKG